MADLIVLAFEKEETAEEVRKSLDGMEEAAIADLNDLVVVTRDANGKTKIDQARRHAGTKIVGGAFWGMLIGLLFFVPGVGLILGAIAGAGYAFFRDAGIPDDFIKELGETIKPGTSALFIMTNTTDPGQLLARLKPYGGKVIQTSLSDQQVEQLRHMYGDV